MIRPDRSRPAWLALLLVTATTGIAAAQHHEAEAEQLFRDGKKLMTEKKFGEACTAFETSNRLDPEIATLMNLADCREKNAQIQSAWTAFLEAERQTRSNQAQAALRKTARERATKLESRLSYLTVSVARSNDVEGLALTRNGEPFDEGLWSAAIPVDGGSYVIGGRAPGHEEWSTTVTVPGEGGRIGVEVPRLKKVKDDVRVDVATERTPSALSGRRKLGLGIGAAGLLALGVGVVFGVQANGFDQDASDLCPTLSGCARAADANARVDQAQQRARYANLSYGIGGAAVVAAAIVWFTGGPEQAAVRTAVSPVVTTTSVGLDVAVRF